MAHERCNAVGTVELSCGPRGLWVRFVRISPFSEGYVPYPTASGHSITVPYDQVAGVATGNDGLVHLTLDPSCTPFNRLALAALVRGTALDHHASYLRRAKIEKFVTLGALAAWIPMTVLTHLVAPGLSMALVIAFAGSLSLLAHGLRRDFASRVALFGNAADLLRSEFLADLALRLGPERILHAHAVESVQAVAAERYADVDSAEAASLRSLFATAGVVAAVALIAILVGKSLVWLTPSTRPQEQAQEEGVPQKATAPGVSPTGINATITPDPLPPKQLLPPCTCDRADSALWIDGVPRLSILATNRPGKTSGKRPSVYPEIAIVNNSNQALKDVALTVDFLLSPHDGQPGRRLREQGLFYDGRLDPGEAIKWRIKGRGDDYTITSLVTGKLGDSGIDAAPADAFHKLLSAHTPSVRLHGAKMLAWLGDPRAREAIEKLGHESRQEMGQTLAMLADTVRPIRVCAVKVTPDASSAMQLQACVFNGSSETLDRPMVTARSDNGVEVRETRWSVDSTIGPGMGVRSSHRVEWLTSDEQAAEQLQVTAEP